MKDKFGKELHEGDSVLVATLNYKSAYLRAGTVKVIEEDRTGVPRARVSTEAGGSTWVRSHQVAKVAA